MRAAVLTETGAPEVLAIREVAHPVPVLSEFLVQVVAAGINPIDAKTRAGGALAAQLHSPAILGYDFSGIVVTSPYEGHPIKPGDEVFGMVPVPRQQGTYAEYVVAPSTAIARKPASLTHTEAAGVPLATSTGWVSSAHEPRSTTRQPVSTSSYVTWMS